MRTYRGWGCVRSYGSFIDHWVILSGRSETKVPISFSVQPLGSERDFKLDLDRATAEQRQIDYLRRQIRSNELHYHDVRWIRELQIEIVKLRDVRGIDPD